MTRYDNSDFNSNIMDTDKYNRNRHNNKNDTDNANKYNTIKDEKHTVDLRYLLI